MASKFFIQKDGETSGPMSSSDLMTLAQSGKVAPNDLVWKEGSEKKVRAGQVKGLLFKSPEVVPPSPVQDDVPSPVKDKVPPVNSDPATSGEFYYEISGEREGPVSFSELQTLVQKGVVTKQTQVWHDGLEGWTQASEFDRLASTFPLVTKKVPPPLKKAPSPLKVVPPPVIVRPSQTTNNPVPTAGFQIQTEPAAVTFDVSEVRIRKQVEPKSSKSPAVIACWLFVGVFALGAVLFVPWYHKLSQQRTIETANYHIVEATEFAKEWLAVNSSRDGETVEKRLADALQRKDATEKSEGNVVLNQVRQRREEIRVAREQKPETSQDSIIIKTGTQLYELSHKPKEVLNKRLVIPVTTRVYVSHIFKNKTPTLPTTRMGNEPGRYFGMSLHKKHVGGDASIAGGPHFSRIEQQQIVYWMSEGAFQKILQSFGPPTGTDSFFAFHPPAIMIYVHTKQEASQITIGGKTQYYTGSCGELVGVFDGQGEAIWKNPVATSTGEVLQFPAKSAAEPSIGNTELHPIFQKMLEEARIPLTKSDSKTIVLEVMGIINDVKNRELSKSSPKIIAWENGLVLIGKGEIPSGKIAQAIVERLLSGDLPFTLKFRDEIQKLAKNQGRTPENVMKELLLTLNRTAETSTP